MLVDFLVKLDLNDAYFTVPVGGISWHLRWDSWLLCSCVLLCGCRELALLYSTCGRRVLGVLLCGRSL